MNWRDCHWLQVMDMADDSAFEFFFRALRAEVTDRAAGVGADDGPDFKENALTDYIIHEFLEEYGVTENAEVCYFERDHPRGKAKANGFAINEDGDELHIFTTILVDRDQPQSVTKDLLESAASRAVRFFEQAAAGGYDGLEQASDQYSFATSVRDAVPTLTKVRLFIVTDGIASQHRFKIPSSRRIAIETEVWDARRLFRSGQSTRTRPDIAVDVEDLAGALLPCLPMPQPASDYMAYLTMFPAQLLHRIYDEYGPRVLEYNVRSFLQSKGKVNSAIRKTLREEPHHFFAFNNGLATTVDSVEIESSGDGVLRIRKLNGFQIVNGGQTTASIHRAIKDDRADLSNVLVPVKITVVASENLAAMVERISLSANSQNAVTMADFSANHPFHVEIERLANSTWMPGEQGKWFYERARGGYQVARLRDATTPAQRKRFEEITPPARKFVKTDLAKYIAVWEQLPHQASRGAQKNFIAFHSWIHGLGDRWKPDVDWYKSLIAKAILFKHIERVVRQAGFSAYKANITAYTVAYLAWAARGRFDFLTVWAHQAVSPALDQLLRLWVESINAAIRESAGGRNVTEWAKKEDCWSAVRTLQLPFPHGDPPEFSGQPAVASTDLAKAAVAPVDRHNVARCVAVDGATWFRIQAWGRQTGKLSSWDAGVALSLAGLASEGWVKEPTRKQAARGVLILQTALEHGLLEDPGGV
jgi:hypothetical protein